MLAAGLSQNVDTVLPASHRRIHLCYPLSYRPFFLIDARFHPVILAFQQLASILGACSKSLCFHRFANFFALSGKLRRLFSTLGGLFWQKQGQGTRHVFDGIGFSDAD
jgi:hypothetical protein